MENCNCNCNKSFGGGGIAGCKHQYQFILHPATFGILGICVFCLEPKAFTYKQMFDKAIKKDLYGK